MNLIVKTFKDDEWQTAIQYLEEVSTQHETAKIFYDGLGIVVSYIDHTVDQETIKEYLGVQ